MEEFVKKLGFKDEEEFHHLVASVDISSSKKFKAFKLWQDNDGTKEGILKLPTRIIKIIKEGCVTVPIEITNIVIEKDENEELNQYYVDVEINGKYAYIAVVENANDGAGWVYTAFTVKEGNKQLPDLDSVYDDIIEKMSKHPKLIEMFQPEG